MKNIKKLLVYPLAFVLFFGLTSNTCDSIEDLAPEIEIPLENTYVFEVEVTQEQIEQLDGGSIEIFETVNPGSSSELEQYEDQIEDAKLKEITIEVEDLLEGSSTFGVGYFSIDFDQDGRSDYIYSIIDIRDFDGATLTVDDFDGSGNLEEDFRASVANGTPFDFRLSTAARDVMHYRITATMSAITTVQP